MLGRRSARTDTMYWFIRFVAGLLEVVWAFCM
jgi:hypothetical protein